MISLICHIGKCESFGENVSLDRLTPTVRVVKRSLPWVVNIGTRERKQVDDVYDHQFNQFFQRHYDNNPDVAYYPLGSGVIVDPGGLILSNFHVVQRASVIEVRFWNGKVGRARMVGFDVPNDLCLLQLENPKLLGNFPSAPFARPRDLLLGETVVAIGNPFGLEHSVSSGVISAFDRGYSEGDVSFSDIIQTDAMVNPGNSGGPLINMDGNLIGINLAIRNDAQGICFAIPLARIELFLSKWMRPCHFSSGYLGMAEGPILDVGKNGVRLPEILPNSPLDKAGLKKGMEIVAVNGHKISRPIDFAREIYHLSPGSVASFTLADGSNRNVNVADMPMDYLVELRTGLKLSDLTPDMCKAFGVAPDLLEGVIVAEVYQDRFFAMQKQQWRDILKRGDIITGIAGQQVRNMHELSSIMRTLRSGDIVNVNAISIVPAKREYRKLVFSMVVN